MSTQEYITTKMLNEYEGVLLNPASAKRERRWVLKKLVQIDCSCRFVHLAQRAHKLLVDYSE